MDDPLTDRISEHRCTYRITFADTDAAGVAHFSTYFRLMENTEHDLYRRIGTHAFVVEAGGFKGMPRVRATCEFKAPLRFEEEVDVRLTVVELGQKKIRYGFLFTRAHGTKGGEVVEGDAMAKSDAMVKGDVVAEGEMTVVFAGKAAGEASFSSFPVPAEISDRLMEFEA